MKKYLLTILKYGFSFALILAGFTTMHSMEMVILSCLELAFVFVLTNSLKQVNKHFQILNNVAMLLFNAQCLVVWFGSSYISYVMLENMDSLSALRGRIVAYSLGVIFVLVMSFLPVQVLEYKTKLLHMITPVVLVLEVVCVILVGTQQQYTPACGYIKLMSDAKEQFAMKQTMKNLKLETENASMEEMFSFDNFEIEEEPAQDDSALTDNEETQQTQETQEEQSVEAVTAEEVSEEVDATAVYDSVSDGFGLLEGKNIILIFTEGLSKSVIWDSRGIMPNMAALSNNCLEFTNYYNHTFATYRGIQGQLFSGHQVEMYDKNNLPSMMTALKEAGYYTAMINVEAENSTFTQYLNNLGFDEVYSDLADGHNMLDANAYGQLLNKALELQQSGQKFFLAIYTFETHASFDSSDQIFGDGSNAELNKFYNCDYQFGKFYDAFRESTLSYDTAFILTADHATYGDELFVKTFPEYSKNRTCAGCDQIPFYLYFQGYQRKVDAAGRNSLDMAPTVLDMLGIQPPDTFLGTSLFYPKVREHAMDTYFWCPGTVYFTGNNAMEHPGNRWDAVTQMVTKYSILSQQ